MSVFPMYLENICTSFEAAFGYSKDSDSDQKYVYLINWVEHVFKDILFYTIEERFDVKVQLLKLFCDNFDYLSVHHDFITLINFIIEVNIRWLVITPHSLQTVAEPFSHIGCCTSCHYENESIMLIRRYAADERLERAGPLFYSRRRE